MTRALAVAVLALLALAAPAAASEERPTLEELERELVCPTCETSLAVSSSPIAERMRVFIRARIAAGDTKSEIKGRLVAEFGEEVLAAPPKSGFNLVAWILPLAGLGLAAVVLGVLARRWLGGVPEAPSRTAPSNGRAPLDPELERRVDEELARFDA
ncbi:MAG: cytochrome c-type biogenesis protein CcmH [Actinomycetota bacterium]|nr:cytochrome c-type biogenesis protein CcmH [Actinomycetota bacterium]